MWILNLNLWVVEDIIVIVDVLNDLDGLLVLALLLGLGAGVTSVVSAMEARVAAVTRLLWMLLLLLLPHMMVMAVIKPSIT